MLARTILSVLRVNALTTRLLPATTLPILHARLAGSAPKKGGHQEVHKKAGKPAPQTQNKDTKQSSQPQKDNQVKQTKDNNKEKQNKDNDKPIREKKEKKEKKKSAVSPRNKKTMLSALQRPSNDLSDMPLENYIADASAVITIQRAMQDDEFPELKHWVEKMQKHGKKLMILSSTRSRIRGDTLPPCAVVVEADKPKEAVLQAAIEKCSSIKEQQARHGPSLTEYLHAAHALANDSKLGQGDTHYLTANFRVLYLLSRKGFEKLDEIMAQAGVAIPVRTFRAVENKWGTYSREFENKYKAEALKAEAAQAEASQAEASQAEASRAEEEK